MIYRSTDCYSRNLESLTQSEPAQIDRNPSPFNLLSNGQIGQDLIAPTSHHQRPQIATDLFDSRPPPALVVPCTPQHLLSLPVDMLQDPPRQDFEIRQLASQPRCLDRGLVHRLQQVGEFFHVRVCRVELSAEGGEFPADDGAFDQFVAESFPYDGVAECVFGTKSREAQAGTGEPEAFVVEVSTTRSVSPPTGGLATYWT